MRIHLRQQNRITRRIAERSKVDRLERCSAEQIGSESFEAVRGTRKTDFSPALPDRMKSVLFSSARARLAGSCSKGRNKPECGRLAFADNNERLWYTELEPDPQNRDAWYGATLERK